MIRTLLTGALLLAAAAAQAQPYPAKPIRLIVPYPPGGATDAIVRPLVQSLTQSLGTQFIVDNRGGGATMIGAGLVAKAPADGYTLLVCGNASHAVSPQIYSHAAYDPFRDFEPITLLASSPTVLFTHSKFAISSLAELVEAAKANPGKFSYVSSGAGTPPHLSTEIFMSMAGIKLLHVPYKGGGDSLSDMIAGRVDLKFGSAPEAIPPVKAGRLKALAIALDTRWPDLPGVPTFGESGWPDYKTGTWYGLCAPAKTPKAIIDRVYREARDALASSDLRERLRLLGAGPGGSSPQDFAAFIRTEYEKYGKVIKTLSLRVD
ncbi:MAG: tripartite tricarboxylate transporter substrate binding protein [Betaproteobacteria bacterium]|nr:tripartite tricarboxylate transporter substrate binding protein [Betaproteobacteria bacterium]